MSNKQMKIKTPKLKKVHSETNISAAEKTFQGRKKKRSKISKPKKREVKDDYEISPCR